MDITELKQQILDDIIKPYYVFYGEELALQDVYVQEIAKRKDMQILHVDSVDSIYINLIAKSLVKSKPKIFVVRNDDEYFKNEKLQDKLLKAKSLRGNILIVKYSGQKETASFFKKHKDVSVKFDYIGESLLKNRLMATTGMPEPYCLDIVRLCGNNYGRIQNELYKLGTYARINGFSWNTAYLEAKKHDMIHEEIGDIIFDFTNAVVERNIKKAYNLWPKMKYTGDGTMKVLSVLYNSFRQILMVQSTPDNMRTEEVLGMTKAQIYVTSQKCNKYNIYEVVNIVKTLRYLEKGIKIGTVAEEFAMDYLMGTIW